VLKARQTETVGAPAISLIQKLDGFPDITATYFQREESDHCKRGDPSGDNQLQANRHNGPFVLVGLLPDGSD
jgi:hypothetical protein